MGSDPNQEEYIMSEQEKNTTPAQNAAPAAPKPPKIDNAALKKAAAALREENNPQNFNAVINLMMRGVFPVSYTHLTLKNWISGRISPLVRLCCCALMITPGC